MSYLHSQLDINLSNWFKNDNSNALLRRIYLSKGQIRSLKPCSIDFDYPISAIAGKNGSGKSTLLAIAACAFHNLETNDYPVQNRNAPYYTFSNFLIQSEEEIPPDGIQIIYGIAHNYWQMPNGTKAAPGVGFQLRKKEKGGRWNEYSGRVDRCVIFLGIERVVPHAEKRVSKSYRSSFRSHEKKGWEGDVKDYVSRILGKSYDDFYFKSHSRYRLPLVQKDNVYYSGFNMGAGESALFEIFSTLVTCPSGSLVVIDEIELGLHEEAQGKLIEQLKIVCERRRLQIICTTHSARILSRLPPEGRFYIEQFDDRTHIIQGISSAYATGKLGGKNSEELTVFVEDGISECIIEAAIPRDIRSRIQIVSIGSSSAVLMQMAARYKDVQHKNVIAFLDGDKRSADQKNKNFFLNSLENPALRTPASEWIQERLNYLPGDNWPEQWLLRRLLDIDLKEVASSFNIEEVSELRGDIEKALLAGKHNEFHELSTLLHITDMKFVTKMVVRAVMQATKDAASSINAKVKERLE